MIGLSLTESCMANHGGVINTVLSANTNKMSVNVPLSQHSTAHHATVVSRQITNISE